MILANDATDHKAAYEFSNELLKNLRSNTIFTIFWLLSAHHLHNSCDYRIFCYILLQDPLCTTETVTVSVSSECQEPLVGVTFTSPELMDVSSLSPGIYMMSVCVLPQEVSGVKSGYEPVTQMVSETSVAMQMTCNCMCLSQI